MLNQKGGVGKSSTVFHLAGGMVEAGKRVLLVDLDPQGSLSQGFFGSSCVEMIARILCNPRSASRPDKIRKHIHRCRESAFSSIQYAGA
jgi:cellulose biosynthesis protein BcsQ